VRYGETRKTLLTRLWAKARSGWGETLPDPRVVVQRARAFTEAALACRPAAMLAALVLLAFKIVFGHVPLRLNPRVPFQVDPSRINCGGS